jgi:hypothetical protein
VEGAAGDWVFTLGVHVSSRQRASAAGFERVFRFWISFYGLRTQGGLTPLAAEVPRWDGCSRIHRRAGLAHGVAGDLQFDAMTVVLGGLRECQHTFRWASPVLDSGRSSSPSLYWRRVAGRGLGRGMETLSELGHRTSRSTAIYLKLDSEELRAVALPLPVVGGAP